MQTTYAGQADSVRTLAVRFPGSLYPSGFFDRAVWYDRTRLAVSFEVGKVGIAHVSESCKSFIMISPDVNSSPISAESADNVWAPAIEAYPAVA
jgi:hypothetical protein